MELQSQICIKSKGGCGVNYSIGVDIGGTKVACGLINEYGNVIEQKMVPSETTSAETMFQCVVSCIESLLSSSSIPKEQLTGIGVGVPGKVDRENGVAIFQNNIPWANFPVVDRLKEALAIDHIVIDNDVYMAAYAEWKSNKLSDELMVYVTVSTGISSAIIHGGEFIRGAGFAGEIGLIPVCTTEGRQPLEKIAAGPALSKQASTSFSDEVIETKTLFKRYYEGHSEAIIIVNQFIDHLAQGIYMINSLLDPHRIIFGGSVAIYNPVILDLLKERLQIDMLEEQKHVLNQLYVSELGSNQGIVGAGLTVFDTAPKQTIGTKG